MKRNSHLKVLVLELDNPEISEVLDKIKNLSGSSGKVPKKAHITVRGPYIEEIPEQIIKSVVSVLNKVNSMKVVGLNRFNNANEDVIYLSVDAGFLRKIWWKKDFPISTHGFNPHITIYRGPKNQADIIYNELSQKKFAIEIKKWHLKFDRIGQKELDF